MTIFDDRAIHLPFTHHLSIDTNIHIYNYLKALKPLKQIQHIKLKLEVSNNKPK